MGRPPRIASPGQLGTDRDQGFDTSSVAAPNAKQGRDRHCTRRWMIRIANWLTPCPCDHRRCSDRAAGGLQMRAGPVAFQTTTPGCPQLGHEVSLRPGRDDPDCSISAVGPPCRLRVGEDAADCVRGCARSLPRVDTSERQLPGAHRQELLLPVPDRAWRRRPTGASELTDLTEVTLAGMWGTNAPVVSF
jgi:hypothetical protein